MAVTITVQSQQVGSLIIRVQAADATWTTLTSLMRSDPWGNRFPVRNTVGASLSGGLAIVEDAEAPLGVEVTYTATVAKVSGTTTLTDVGTTHVVTQVDHPWRVYLADADDPSTMYSPHVEGVPEITRQTRVGVYEVLGRANPIITTGKASSRGGVLNLLTAVQDDNDRIWNLLRYGDVLLFRTTRDYGIGTLYFVPTEVAEERVTRLGQFPQRRFTIEFMECDPPVGDAGGAAWNNWQRVLDNVDPNTWQAVLDQRPTWEKVLTDPFGVTGPPAGREAVEVSGATG